MMMIINSQLLFINSQLIWLEIISTTSFIVDIWHTSVYYYHKSVVNLIEYQELKDKYLAVYFHGLQQTEGVDNGQL